MNHIDIMGQFADLKDIDYRNSLAITVLIDLFIEKGFFTKEDFSRKSAELEQSSIREVTSQPIFQVVHALQRNSTPVQL
jgi:hypothetical protein